MPESKELTSSFRPFRQRVSDRDVDSRGIGETEFEKTRGINSVEVRRGLASAYLSGLAEPAMESRLAALDAIEAAGISVDFLKLSPGAMSFLIDESDQEKLRNALTEVGISFELVSDRCVVHVHAVNMQDEEGLIARVLSEVIASGEQVDHVGDMHDRLLLVTDAKTGERLAQRIRERLPKEVVE